MAESSHYHHLNDIFAGIHGKISKKITDLSKITMQMTFFCKNQKYASEKRILIL